MPEIIRPGRAIAADMPWWLAVPHVCPYCECAYRLVAGDAVAHHHDTTRGAADGAGVVRLVAIPYVQSACPSCGRAVATQQPIGFVAASAVRIEVGG